MSILPDALTLLKDYGPILALAILLCAFVLWRDYKREARLSARINALEDEMRGVIVPLVKRCSNVIARNTVVMERVEKKLATRRRK